jgi:predicted transcriptional regulator
MTNAEQVSVRLDAELRAQLEKIAAKEDRPMASVIRRTLRQALQGQGEARAAA